MRNPFEEIIESYFADVFENYALEKKISEYSPEHFGDALVTYMSPTFDIRFIKDRSQIFVEFSSPGANNWFDLIEIMRAITLKEESGTIASYKYFEDDVEPQRETNQINHLAIALKPYWQKIAFYFKNKK